ncbi:hypothetical protein F383_37899 [Gossypium arboreum]|uniref:Uncharacterized protein n=1 Tax=Gossypium arboreum TaxID=29729 RepID=A0A0B0M8Y9_GOSAR|nr:hypothetical protein F383_37899 [Gossypium arboreum]
MCVLGQTWVSVTPTRFVKSCTVLSLSWHS